MKGQVDVRTDSWKDRQTDEQKDRQTEWDRKTKMRRRRRRRRSKQIYLFPFFISNERASPSAIDYYYSFINLNPTVQYYFKDKQNIAGIYGLLCNTISIVYASKFLSQE